MPSDRDLPSDGQTLLSTPRNTILRDIQPGLYWHGGFKNAVMSWKKLNLNSEFQTAELAININGLSLSKSSSSSLWPISFESDNCCQLINKTVVLVGNIATCSNSNKTVIIVSNTFKIKEDLFNKTCKSTLLNIFKVCELHKNKILACHRNCFKMYHFPPEY